MGVDFFKTVINKSSNGLTTALKFSKNLKKRVFGFS